MSATVALSLAGLIYTASTSFKPQKLEGTKTCDFATVQILQRDENKIYMKYDDRVFVMLKQPTAEGVKNIKRFETKQKDMVFLQLPEKAMLLDNKAMKPILNECLDV